MPHGGEHDPITDAILAALTGGSTPKSPEDRTAYNPATGNIEYQQFDPATQQWNWTGVVASRPPSSGGSTVIVNPSTTSPANVGSLTIEDIQRMVGEAGGRLQNYGGVYVATFQDGSTVEFQPSAKTPGTGTQYYNPGSVKAPAAAGAAGKVTDAGQIFADILNASKASAGATAGTGATTGTPQQPVAPAAPVKPKFANTAEQLGLPSNMDPQGQFLQPEGGGIVGANSDAFWLAQQANLAASPSGADVFSAYPRDLSMELGSYGIKPTGNYANDVQTLQQLIAKRGQLFMQNPAASASDVQKFLTAALTNTKGLDSTPSLPLYSHAKSGQSLYGDLGSIYEGMQIPQYAQGGSMTVNEPSIIQGLLSGKPYGVMGAGAGERVSNITPLGNERQQRMAGRHESAIARALGAGRTMAAGGQVYAGMGDHPPTANPVDYEWPPMAKDPPTTAPMDYLDHLMPPSDSPTLPPAPSMSRILGRQRSNSMNWSNGILGRDPWLTSQPPPPYIGILPGEDGPTAEQSAWGQDWDGWQHGQLMPNGAEFIDVDPRNGVADWMDAALLNNSARGGNDRNNNGIDDREEEWTSPDGSKYKRKRRRGPGPSTPPPTPNVFAGGGSINTNMSHDPLVLEMMARGIRRRARGMLPKGVI